MTIGASCWSGLVRSENNGKLVKSIISVQAQPKPKNRCILRSTLFKPALCCFYPLKMTGFPDRVRTNNVFEDLPLASLAWFVAVVSNNRVLIIHPIISYSRTISIHPIRLQKVSPHKPLFRLQFQLRPTTSLRS